MTTLSLPNNSECSSAEIKIINFFRVKIDNNDKEELESFLEDGVSPQLLNGEILWEEMCGSSYEALDLAFHESLPDDYPNMVTMPPQEALHSVNDIKKQCPTIENDVYVKQYVEPEKYQIVLFVNSEKPSTWYGFVAISHEKSKDYSTYSLHAELEMVYVRPEFRGMNLGIVMAREVGRLISEGFSSIVEQHEKSLSSVFISVSGQGVNPAGRRCLESFNDGVGMYLSGYLFDDIQIEHSFVDEY